MESDNNYAYIGGDDAEQKELLELENKNKNELENQKMQLQQLENKQVEEAAPAQSAVVKSCCCPSPSRFRK